MWRNKKVHVSLYPKTKPKNVCELMRTLAVMKYIYHLGQYKLLHMGWLTQSEKSSWNGPVLTYTAVMVCKTSQPPKLTCLQGHI